MKRFALPAGGLAGALVALGLAGCSPAGPGGEASRADLAPIAPDYRKSIVVWARGFYADPHSLRGVMISDPVPARDGNGRLLWLVCIEADARGRDGAYLGSERQAFGFAPNYVSAPLERRGASLTRDDCGTRALTWRPWSGLAGL